MKTHSPLGRGRKPVGVRSLTSIHMRNLEGITVSGSRQISPLGAGLYHGHLRGKAQPRADTAFGAGAAIAAPATQPQDKLGNHLQLLMAPRDPTEPNRFLGNR